MDSTKSSELNKWNFDQTVTPQWFRVQAGCGVWAVRANNEIDACMMADEEAASYRIINHTPAKVLDTITGDEYDMREVIYASMSTPVSPIEIYDPNPIPGKHIR